MPVKAPNGGGDLGTLSGKYKKKLTMLIIIFAALGGILYGYDIGVISGALLFLNKDITLTTEQTGFIVAAVLFGGCISTLISGFVADVWGRRNVLIVGTILFLIGVFLTVICNSYGTLLAGRFIQGFGIGVVSMILPVYISEVVPPNLRGRAIALFQLFLTLGITIAYFIDLAFTSSGNWRAMFGMVLIPGVIFIIGISILPESPSFFFLRKGVEKAKNALKKVYFDDDVEVVLGQMETLKKEREIARGSKIKQESVFKKAYMIPFGIALAVAILQQFTGINVILQYCPVIYKDAGVTSNMITMLLSTGVTVLNVIFTIVSLILIDKLGRKKLLSIGTVGLTIGLVLCALSFLFGGSGQAVLLTIGFVVFICLYAVGPGVIVWLVMSEYLPARIRGKGMAICLFANSLASSFLSAVVLLWAGHIGFQGVFWIFVITSAIYAYIAIFILPEAKGKTLEEIEEGFRHGKKA